METEMVSESILIWPVDPAAYLPYRVEPFGQEAGNNAWHVWRFGTVWDGPFGSEFEAVEMMRQRAAEDGLVNPNDGVHRPMSSLGFCYRLLEKANRLLIITRVGVPRQNDEGVLECFNLHVVTQEARPQAYWLLGRARNLLPYDYDERNERLCLDGGQYSKPDEIREALSEAVYGDRSILAAEVL